VAEGSKRRTNSPRGRSFGTHHQQHGRAERARLAALHRRHFPSYWDASHTVRQILKRYHGTKNLQNPPVICTSPKPVKMSRVLFQNFATWKSSIPALRKNYALFDVPAPHPYTYASSTHRFPDERTRIEATPLSATSAEFGLGLGLGLGLGSLARFSLHSLPFFSSPSFHTLSLSPAFTSVWWSD
jgi:hypothetical protein